MTKKKNAFLTFCFSLIPGAGEMYMGFMKMGLSLMTLFFLIVTIAAWLEIGPLVVMAVVAWFYSFFHVHNLRGMADEDFYAVEDDYLFHLADSETARRRLTKGYRKLAAVILIVVGVVLIWQSFYSVVGYMNLPDWMYEILYSILRYLPKLVIGVVVIATGIFMIRGKKLELFEEDGDTTSKEEVE
ncbi:MAG: hypothetical protein ACI4DO_04000 [Roseburia sp.]